MTDTTTETARLKEEVMTLDDGRGGVCLGICGRGPERQEKAPGDEAEGQ